MNFYSQAGQDQFVHKLLPITNGTFWDIGCGGLEISNTLALEQVGWRGLLMDNSPEAQKASVGRISRFILADATIYRFPEPERIDYLSLDIDAGTLSALMNLPLNKTRFSIITIEHDAYRFGDTLRAPMRKILKNFGYNLVCADVKNPDPFEDWWVDDLLWDKANRFLSSGMMWTDIFAEAEATT